MAKSKVVHINNVVNDVNFVDDFVNNVELLSDVEKLRWFGKEITKSIFRIK